MLDRSDSKDRALAISYITKGRYKPAVNKLKEMQKNDPDEKIRFLAKIAYETINHTISN